MRSKRGWLFTLCILATLLTAGLTISCGGGEQNLVSSNPPASPPPASSSAPPGTYTITVVATSASLQHPMTLSLTIQ